LSAVLRRNVLILHTGALGDFVLSWPLVLALGRIHPQSRIIVVTHASKGALAEAALRVESADIEQGWHVLFADGAQLAERPAKLLEGAHAVYTFVGRDDVLRKVAPHAQVTSLQPTPRTGYASHSSQHLLDQLAAVPAVRSAVEQIFKSVNTRGISTGRSHDGDVVVHPGSGSRDKCWPVERFVKLIERFRRGRKDVRVIVGEVETERFSPDETRSLEAVATTLRRPASYLELFNELRTASLFIGNDSGPGHLAGIMGLPSVILFGPGSDPAVWRPNGPRVRTLRGEPGIDKIASHRRAGGGEGTWLGLTRQCFQ
jgi:ADP-heptose:LPS heptosyltransferase